jgi:hypothetical protein
MIYILATKMDFLSKNYSILSLRLPEVLLVTTLAHHSV